MALSANWSTKVITVPLSDLTVVTPGVRYSLTCNFWWQLLRELAGSEEGIAQTYLPSLFPYRRTAASDVTPPITDLINGFTVFFDSGPYTLDIIEGNTNIGDPAIHPAGDNVSVNTNNTTGLVVTGSGVLPSDYLAIADQVWKENLTDHSGDVGSTAEALNDAKNFPAIPTVGDIADGVWDEPQADHTGIGTTGESLDDASQGGSTPAQIAAAVWADAKALTFGKWFGLRKK